MQKDADFVSSISSLVINSAEDNGTKSLALNILTRKELFKRERREGGGRPRSE